jgi:hypothetical protein
MWGLGIVSVIAFAVGFTVNEWRLGQVIATIQAEHNAQVADANAKTIVAQQQAQEIGDKLSEAMMKSRWKAQAGTNLIRKEIDDAQKNKPNTCTFDPDWVRLYNASLNPDASTKD